MRRRFESLLPALVLLGFLAAAVVVNLLLTNAEERGVDALEESVTGEVEAIARSQDQRYEGSFGNAQGLSSGLKGDPFELVLGSAADEAQLQELLQLIESASPEPPESGFYLMDLQGQITSGVLLKEGVLGDTFDQPGFADPDTQERLARRGAVLPVGQGLTTDQPVLTYILPIRVTADEATAEVPEGTPRGRFVFEQVVSEDSPLNQEIKELGRADTDEYYFFDGEGGVIGSNDAASIGQMVDDERLRDSDPGLYRFDDQVVVLADVPGPGWRVAFRQDVDEFEQALTGPLQSTGRILIFALLAAGVVLMVVLLRRLRFARAEQERLRVLSEAQQEFISIVSHELRTPVSGVLGFLETCLDHWDVMQDEERKAAIGRAASNARRLQAMTRDVLDTESVEAGRLVHVFERLDLAAEVRMAVDASNDLDPDRQIDFDRPDGPVWVQGDGDRLQQVLANLIENARKNSPAMEPIEVTVHQVGDSAEVVVADRGPGIAEESLERIFEKFVRGRGDTVTGTGLGLYISRQIVSAHGGRIWAESQPGAGATLRFALPALSEPAEQDSAHADST